MRETHPVFDVAPRDSTIWRYFDLPKFVSLLQRRSLFFSRANLLGDPLEGSFTYAREAERQAFLANPPDGRTREDLEEVFRHNASQTANALFCAYINCWHMGEHESMAMWRGYGAGPYGIAIRSTFGLLDDVLPSKFSEVPMSEIMIGRVRYLDYTSVTARLNEEYNVFSPFMSKSLPYQHEAEVRAMFIDMTCHGRRDSPVGHFVPVDLNHLIQRVTVSPLAPQWYQEIVQELCKNAGLSPDVGRSIVFGEPIY